MDSVLSTELPNVPAEDFSGHHDLYEIAASAKIQGRTEGIGTTVQHVDQVGQLQPAGVGFTVDAVPTELQPTPERLQYRSRAQGGRQ
jgi:hypothetical protein